MALPDLLGGLGVLVEGQLGGWVRQVQTAGRSQVVNALVGMVLSTLGRRCFLRVEVGVGPLLG